MRNQKGYTLLEIVMVLVLIGILASIAVPKYFDMQSTALQKAAIASVAEAQSRLNTVFGEQLLSGNSCNSSRSKAVENTSFTDNGKLGDFTVAGGSWESGDTGSITLSGMDNSFTLTANLVLPTCGEDQAGSVQQSLIGSSTSISSSEDNQESLVKNQENTTDEETAGESQQQQIADNQDTANNVQNIDQSQQIVADNQDKSNDDLQNNIEVNESNQDQIADSLNKDQSFLAWLLSDRSQPYYSKYTGLTIRDSGYGIQISGKNNNTISFNRSRFGNYENYK